MILVFSSLSPSCFSVAANKSGYRGHPVRMRTPGLAPKRSQILPLLLQLSAGAWHSNAAKRLIPHRDICTRFTFNSRANAVMSSLVFIRSNAFRRNSSSNFRGRPIFFSALRAEIPGAPSSSFVSQFSRHSFGRKTRIESECGWLPMRLPRDAIGSHLGHETSQVTATDIDMNGGKPTSHAIVTAHCQGVTSTGKAPSVAKDGSAMVAFQVLRTWAGNVGNSAWIPAWICATISGLSAATS